jgi:hypothetical protein
MKEKLKEKAVILLQESKTKTLTFHQHSILTQNFESLEDKSHQN